MARRKDYLSWENARNKTHHKLYTDILRECFGEDGILIAHHLCFDGNEDAPEEIPSADTLIFDHEVAEHIFGPNFKKVLCDLAMVPADERDEVLGRAFYGRQALKNVGLAS